MDNGTTDFRETLYTIGKRGERHWVYPTIVPGAFRRYRKVVAAVLMCIYLAMPWLTVDGKQAILLNIFERKFTFFGQTFWATDSYYLFLLFGILALCLFFFTAILGRVWCGWACPETVFLEFLFRPLETLIEGTPAQRKRLDNSSLSLQKLFRKTLKWSIFALLAWILASTALAYFFGKEPLLKMMTAPPWENPQPFSVTLFLMGVLLFQFGWFREQFCTVLCPYARFQSVLLDSDSLLVGYDRGRGEPRGKLTKDEKEEQTKGDCIDCGLCVRVCPTGIDIRNGLQLECIQCAACADACDSVMERIGRPLGLVRYDTEAGIEGRKRRVLRPRVFIYGFLLLSFFSIFGVLLQNRSLSEFQIIRSVSGEPFQLRPDGHILNQFKVHISNKSEQEVRYVVELADDSPVELTVPSQPYPVGPESLATVPLFISFDTTLLNGGTRKLTLRVSGSDGYTAVQEITLIGPG